MKGLGYLTVLPDGSFKGPIDKFLVPEKKAELNSMLNLKTDDTLFFISDNIKVVNLLAGQIRTALGERLEIIDKDRFDMCFITDFPMYERRTRASSTSLTIRFQCLRAVWTLSKIRIR